MEMWKTCQSALNISHGGHISLHSNLWVQIYNTFFPLFTLYLANKFLSNALSHVCSHDSVCLAPNSTSCELHFSETWFVQTFFNSFNKFHSLSWPSFFYRIYELRWFTFMLHVCPLWVLNDHYFFSFKSLKTNPSETSHYLFTNYISVS